MRIDVTQEDIELGLRESCCLCPVARAIARSLDVETGGVSVAHDGILWRHGFEPCPDDIEDFIYRFDDGQPVSPFSFEIDLPASTSKESR